MKFCERLFELREAEKLTQQELANRLGLSLSIVNKWENGKREPTMRALITLADFFDVSIDYLVGRVD